MNDWPPILNVRLMRCQRRHVGTNPYFTGARYALSVESFSVQEFPSVFQGRLTNAQVIMIRDREFRREGTVSYSRGWRMEVNARQRDFEAGGGHWDEESWIGKFNIVGLVPLFNAANPGSEVRWTSRGLHRFGGSFWCSFRVILEPGQDAGWA